MEYMKWTKLAIMTTLSFVAMYALMYVMVDVFSNVYISLDQFYMALTMTSVMIIIEMMVMGSMYEKKVKIITVILGVVLFITSFLFIRRQTSISDKEFLKSMISHHGAALLMCQKAAIEDGEIQALCKDIISSQQSQIDWMKTKLSTLKE